LRLVDAGKPPPLALIDAESKMKVVVVGGGIGGLTTALALGRVADVTVCERAGELKEVGAGIVLASNAFRVLTGLGFGPALSSFGTRIEVAQIRRWDNRLLSRIPVGAVDREAGTETRAVHRADLQQALLSAVGEHRVRLGMRCVGFEEWSDGLAVHFDDGGVIEADVLVGADGINSTIRAQMIPTGAVRYAGYTVWRAVVRPDAASIGPGEATETWGRGARFISAGIGDGRVYWAATANGPEGQSDSPGGGKAAVLRLVKGWHAPIEALVNATDEQRVFRTDAVDRAPLRRWTRGRVTLLGDAAHAMTPDLGQGACQAIEDALVLARCLARDPVPEALRRYEAIRRPRANSMVRGSRRMSVVARLEHPLLRFLRDQAMQHTPQWFMVRQLKAMMDPGTVAAGGERV
jgi:2-polyprenyl-6-methoxyphenol hydroxylase-like FAD-dependent oxidoreductase